MFRLAAFFLVALSLLDLREAEARPRRFWTYADLCTESELVCIATITATKTVENDSFHPEHLDQLESQVRVMAVLKGDKSISKLRFTHYCYKKGVGQLGNGPTFPVLRATSKEAALEGDDADAGRADPKLTFVFFLTRRSDGSYGPVSGDGDAELSVAQLQGYAD